MSACVRGDRVPLTTPTHMLTAVHLPTHDDGVLIDLGPHKGAELLLVVCRLHLPARLTAGCAGVGGQSWEKG